MPFVLKPGRNPTLKLAYALMEAEARKAKKAAKEPEPAEPAKKQITAKRPR
jgi:hypothetical protein